MKSVPHKDYLIIGYRNGLGPLLENALSDRGTCVYFSDVDQLDPIVLDENLGAHSTVIYCDLLFSLDRLYKKKVARRNYLNAESLADLLYARDFSRLIYISHYLAPSLQSIEEASTQNKPPIDLVLGLQRAEQAMQRLRAEDIRVQVIRAPFIGEMPDARPPGTYKLIPPKEATQCILDTALAPFTEELIETHAYTTDRLSDLSEMDNDQVKAIKTSWWNRFTLTFSSDDVIER